MDITLSGDADPWKALLSPEAIRSEVDRLAETVPGTLLIIDLSEIRAVVDRSDKDKGHELSGHMVELMRAMVRLTDPVGYLAADVFVLFLQQVASEDVIKNKITALNRELRQAFPTLPEEAHGKPLTLLAGAAFAPSEGQDYAELCQKAKEALNLAKEEGRLCEVYRSEQEEAGDLRQGILKLQLTLGENRYEPGAYWLEFEEFPVVYRFLYRLVENYQTPVQLLQFRLPKTASKETAQEFQQMLLRTLRRSDCITRNGRRHFLVALIRAKAEDVALVEERIRSVWKKIKSSADGDYTFETDSIGGR